MHWSRDADEKDECTSPGTRLAMILLKDSWEQRLQTKLTSKMVHELKVEQSKDEGHQSPHSCMSHFSHHCDRISSKSNVTNRAMLCLGSGF